MRAIRIACVGVALFVGAIAAGCGGSSQDPAATATPANRALALLLTPTPSVDRFTAAAQTATSFGDFPIVWLGTSYDSDGDGSGDMPLSSAYYLSGEDVVNPRTGEVIRPAQRSFSLAYGTCEIPKGKDQCGIPISIVIEPRDNKLPPLVGANGQITVRGVAADTYDGGALHITTADATITILPAFAKSGGERLNQSLRIANQLRGANAKASQITQMSDLAPVAGASPTSESTPSE